MTKSELRAAVKATGSHFFDRGTMKFFGDTMANYAVSSKPVEVETHTRGKVLCWELRRKRPVKYGLTDSAYFEVGTFAKVFTVK